MPREKKAQDKAMQTVKKIKNSRVEPALPGGFRDYGPADAIAKQRMIDTMRRTFESFGFDPLETSSVQRTEVLTGGEEDSGKIIFNVKGSQEEKSDTSLRFDLTVPLARFVAGNPNIPKPFKRYQIGNVWRGERQQAGRYREFMQADVDIVGSSSVGADMEIVAIIYTVFKNIGIENFVINYNNRKMFNLLPTFAGFPENKLWNVLRIIDKRDKIGPDGVRNELGKYLAESCVAKVLEFLDPKSLDILQGSGFKEYGIIASMLQKTGMDVDTFFKLNRWLVRGLSYYTGSVFEVILLDAPEIGSVCGGGRYDGLVAQFTGQNIPGVGVSFGVDRLFAAMEKLGLVKKNATIAQVMILNLSDDLMPDYLMMAKQLRDVGVNTALYLGDDTSFQAQLSYAVKKEIPYVVIFGDEEKKNGAVAVKNLMTREQKEIRREELAGFFKK